MTRLDAAIALGYLAGVAALSFALRRGRPADVFLAGRRMGWFPIGLSVMITLFSAVNFAAFPTEVMGNGLYALASLPVFALVAIPVTRVFIPFFHGMRLTSLYAYFERRFDRRTRLLAAGIFLFWRLCWMATALYASARLLGTVTGLPWPALLLATGGAAALYTAGGGMRAVMWTDVLQFLVMLGAIIGAVWVATGSVGPGGWAEARTAGLLRPLQPFDPDFFSLRPTVRITLWSALIGTFVAFLARYAADQMVVQRYFTARDRRAAVRGFWWNVVAALAALLLLAALGLAIATGPTGTGLPPMARFGAFIRTLPPGLAGLLVAGLLAATMSSVDSGLNSCVASWMTDFEGREEGKGEDWRQRRHYRVLVFALAGVAMGMAFLVGRQGDLFAIVNRVNNGVGSPLLALLLLAMFSRACNARGAWWGGWLGALASVAISFGLEGLSLHYYAVANLLITLMACWGVSRLTARADPVTAGQRAWMWRAGQKQAEAVPGKSP